MPISLMIAVGALAAPIVALFIAFFLIGQYQKTHKREWFAIKGSERLRTFVIAACALDLVLTAYFLLTIGIG